MNNRGKLMRIPMRYIDGEWVIEFGGDLPIEHGTAGELLLEARRVQDSIGKRLFLGETIIPILDASTTLLAAVDVRDWSEITQDQAAVLLQLETIDNVSHLLRAPVGHRGSYLVPVRLAQPTPAQVAQYCSDTTGLWLRTRGTSAVALISSPVILPDCISTKPAASLNHALTLLSQTYEKWRRSHTGNAYRQYLYEERDGEWYPLGLLRESQLATESQRIAARLWKEIINQL
jgi:hypothetical protein